MDQGFLKHPGAICFQETPGTSIYEVNALNQSTTIENILLYYK